MQNLFLFTSCIAVTTFLGWNVVTILTRGRSRDDSSKLELVGLSYLLGFGVITIQMFIMGILGFKFTTLNILIPWIPIVLVNLLLQKKNKSIESKVTSKQIYSKNEIILFIFIVIQASYNFFRAIIKPIEAYDSVAIYGLKAKIIYLSQGITSSFFENINSYFHGAHPDYPLFISLSETWIYTFLGNFNDIIVKAIFPLFYISFIFVFYAIIKRLIKDKKLAILFTFLLATVKQFSDYATIGLSDMELGIFFAISIFYFYLWTVNREKTYFLNLSLLGAVLSIWTKNEGMLLSFIVVLIVLYYIFSNSRTINRKVATSLWVYVFITLIVALLWVLFKKHNNLINENFNFSMIKPNVFFNNLNKIPAIIYEYQKHLFGFKKWNIIWILWLLLWIKEFKASLSGNIKYITLIFILFALGYGAMYIFSAVEIKFLLSTTGSRFLLHILPVALFWMAILTSKTKLLEGYDKR